MKGLRAALRSLQRLLPETDGGATVLCYHLAGASTGSPVDLPTALFREHMAELAEQARVIPLEEALRVPAIGVEKPVAERPRVVLTFDDAYENFGQVVFPILWELSLPSTVFVPVAFLEGSAPPPNRLAPRPPLSWPRLVELSDSGLVEIGSHGWSHRPLPGLSEPELEHELGDSRARLEETLSRPVRSFCYPGALWNERVEAQVAEIYERAVIGGGRKAIPGRTPPHRIQRISLRRDGPVRLRALLSADLWLEERIADLVRRTGLRSGPPW